MQFFACLLIIFGAEIVAGVFGFMNKEQVLYSNNNGFKISCGCCCHPTSFGLIFTISPHQIVEDVQSFYRNSFTDAPTTNSTAIIYVYHKTVGEVSLQFAVYCGYSVMLFSYLCDCPLTAKLLWRLGFRLVQRALCRRCRGYEGRHSPAMTTCGHMVAVYI